MSHLWYFHSSIISSVLLCYRGKRTCFTVIYFFNFPLLLILVFMNFIAKMFYNMFYIFYLSLFFIFNMSIHTFKKNILFFFHYAYIDNCECLSCVCLMCDFKKYILSTISGSAPEFHCMYQQWKQSFLLLKKARGDICKAALLFTITSKYVKYVSNPTTSTSMLGGSLSYMLACSQQLM